MENNLLEIRKKYAATKQIAENIYLTLREAIIVNFLHAGDRLQEERLARLFQTSRTPIREAVKKLEFEGFVAHDVKYGFQVRIFSPEECIELMEALECLRQITTRAAADTISRANLIRLSENIRRTREDEVGPDTVTLFEEFHRIVAESANNSALYAAYGNVARKYACVLNRHRRTVFNQDAADDHERIYEALAAHNKEKAWRIALEHTEKISIRIRQFLL